MSEQVPWELWWARMKYEESEEEKDRPVLVLEGGEVFILSAKVTSHEARNQWGDYELIMWKSAGLDKPSTVRLSHIARLHSSVFRKKIGMLDILDITNIQRLLMTL